MDNDSIGCAACRGLSQVRGANGKFSAVEINVGGQNRKHSSKKGCPVVDRKPTPQEKQQWDEFVRKVKVNPSQRSEY